MGRKEQRIQKKLEKNPAGAGNLLSAAPAGKSSKRLSGVEPPHMPPEGIALSTELQTHSGHFWERLKPSPFNDLNYPSTYLPKCKEQK